MTIEKRLLDAPLVEPSDRLDRSVEEIIRWAEVSSSVRESRRKPYWFAAAGLAAGLVIGVLAGLLVQQNRHHGVPAATTVYIVEPSPELERWISTYDGRPAAGFFERQHGELETLVIPIRTEQEPSDEL